MADPIKHGSVDEPIANPEKRIDKNQYIRWEYDYIGKKLGFYQKGKQVLVPLTLDGGAVRLVDELHVAEANGTAHVFYFDVTDQVTERGTAAAKALGPKA